MWGPCSASAGGRHSDFVADSDRTQRYGVPGPARRSGPNMSRHAISAPQNAKPSRLAFRDADHPPRRMFGPSFAGSVARLLEPTMTAFPQKPSTALRRAYIVGDLRRLIVQQAHHRHGAQQRHLLRLPTPLSTAGQSPPRRHPTAPQTTPSALPTRRTALLRHPRPHRHPARSSTTWPTRRTSNSATPGPPPSAHHLRPTAPDHHPRWRAAAGGQAGIAPTRSWRAASSHANSSDPRVPHPEVSSLCSESAALGGNRDGRSATTRLMHSRRKPRRMNVLEVAKFDRSD